jgi:hypothetical protein
MTSYIGASPETTIARVRYLYTAVTAQNTFTTATDGQVLSYESTENVDVFVNGVLLVPTTDYAAETGSSIVLVEATDADDKVEVLTYESFQAANYLPTTGGTITGDLTVDTDTLVVDSTNNRVGVGTSLPSTNLHVSSSGDTLLRVTSADGNGAFLDLGDASDPDGGRIVYDSGSNLTFSTASTERLRIQSNGNLQHLSKPAYFARAWVNFKGTGTVSIRESNNVSSITDLGTGDYRVNFFTAMTDANYSIHFGGSPQNGRFLVNWAGTINNGSTAVVNSTSNCRIAMIDGGSGSRQDSTNNYVSIFR